MPTFDGSSAVACEATSTAGQRGAQRAGAIPKPRVAWLLLALLLVPIESLASNAPSYTFVQASYCHEDVDGGFEGDGASIGGSLELGRSAHVFASYATIAFDQPLGIEADSRGWSAGAGYHRDLGTRTSFFGELGLIDAEWDSSVARTSETGVAAAVGLRGMVASAETRGIELAGQVAYVNMDSEMEETQLTAGVYFYFSRRPSTRYPARP
jgi:hypothetical protein